MGTDVRAGPTAGTALHLTNSHLIMIILVSYTVNYHESLRVPNGENFLDGLAGWALCLYGVPRF
eukprot:COSAG02_NODE_6877_length_3312_cov_20.078743_1_plen_64_part_00